MESSLPNIITIGIWVMGLLLSVIGFLLVFYFKRSVSTNDKLNDSVNKLQLTVTGLNGTLLAQDEKFSNLSTNCRDKHSVIDERLKKHGDQLGDHEGRIIKIETKL